METASAIFPGWVPTGLAPSGNAGRDSGAPTGPGSGCGRGPSCAPGRRPTRWPRFDARLESLLLPMRRSQLSNPCSNWINPLQVAQRVGVAEGVGMVSFGGRVQYGAKRGAWDAGVGTPHCAVPRSLRP